MNDDQLNNLFAAARRDAPDTTRVELAFETRLLARLRAARNATPPWFVWTWRLAPIFTAIVIALGVWNYSAATNPLDELHGVDNTDATLVAILTGE